MSYRPFKEFTHAGVHVSRESLEIPTYAPGPGDPNPPILGKGLRSIYPYRWQKSFSTRIQPRTYDAIVLTSPWIRAAMLPDWGMHLYRAVDRLIGRDLFHVPQVLKPAHNALRGAFVAGGVEFNFPVGHSTVTWSRLGVHLRRAEGGVQLLFHNIDRRTGMCCAAGLTLSGDRRGIVFDQYFHNPTPLPQPWYYWLNAGMAPHRSLRFMFPTRQMLGHFEGPFLETVSPYAYPLHEGHDYSRYDDIPEPIGLFSPVHQAGWFGAWYEDWKFGVVRWAPPWQVAGQKFWSWGNSEEGLSWGRIAADQELPVPEIQSGRPETQMDRGVLQPYATTRHHEWWMPVSEIGDVQAASQCGAMAVRQQRGRIEIGLCPAAGIKGCHIQLNGRRAGRSFDLAPGKAKRFNLPASGTVREVEIVGAEGRLLSWSADAGKAAQNVQTLYDSPRPAVRPAPEALVLRGDRYERMMRPDLARRSYEMALKKDEAYALAHLRLGLMELQRDDLTAARDHLELALASNRWSDEALYLHGLASLWSGDERLAAADLLRTAATGDQYAVPALVQLALYARRGRDYLRCSQILADGLERQPGNAALQALRAMEYRRRKQYKELAEECDALDRLLGFSCVANVERQLAGLNDPWIHVPSSTADEDERPAAIAMIYHEAGDDAVAANLLRQARTPEGKTRAAYLLRWLGKPGRRDGEKVCIFAWGRHEKFALTAAIEQGPKDAIAQFALGCLLAEQGHLKEAAGHLARAARLQPKDSVMLTALGTVYLATGQAAKAAAALEAATRAKPVNPTAWVRLDAARRAIGRRSSAWLRRFANAPTEVLQDEEARQTLARLACDLDQYDQAAELLTGRQFHPYELSHELRNLWSEIHRRKALRQASRGDFTAARHGMETALAYPPNLNLGRPRRRFDAMTLYTAGCIAEAQGNAAAAQSYFAQAAQEDQPDPTPAKPWSLLAQLHLGQRPQALRRLAKLQRQAQAYLDTQFAPDLQEPLEEIVAICQRIRQGYRPGLKDLVKEIGGTT